jgi:hypothetical protein
VEELFRSKLKNIINLRHALVRLGELIDGRGWKRILRRSMSTRGQGCRFGWGWDCIC